MYVPSLPTDNLYKFVALSGVFIAFSSTYFFLWSIDRLIEKSIELEESIDIHRAGVNFWEYKTNKIKQILTTVEKENSEMLDAKEISSLSYDSKELEKMVDKDMELRFKMNISMIKVNAKGKKLNELQGKITIYIGFIIVGLLLGLFMALWGFKKWYVIQRVIDGRLINDTETKINTNNSQEAK